MVNWFPWRKRDGTDSRGSGYHSGQSLTRTAPKNSLPITDAAVLLAAPHRQAMIRQLGDLVSCSRSDFESLYLAALSNYAQLVQELPASEAHHHAGRGGMLDHGLETVVRALTLRRGHMLPPGVSPEVQAAKQDVWTYGVFSAALLHDIGKPLADQQVGLVDNSGQVVAIWNPWSGPMVSEYAGYRTAFIRDRDYGLHERVASLIAHQVIPTIGMAWLTNERPLLTVWLAAIQGDIDDADVLGKIVKQADQHSVAQNLVGAEGKVQLATTQVKSLTERLTAGLRYLVDEGHLPLNRRGAAGWCDGSDLWLVSKRVLDDLRAHMIGEGQTGIPSRNDRIMDELQQNGVLASTDDQRAIWKATVELDDGWSQSLTLLRVPVSKLWSSEATRPAIMQGTVTPEGETVTSTQSATANEVVSASPAESVVTNEATTNVAASATSTTPTTDEVNTSTTTSPASEADTLAAQTITHTTPADGNLYALPLPPGVEGLGDLPLPPLTKPTGEQEVSEVPETVTSDDNHHNEGVAMTTAPTITQKAPNTMSQLTTSAMATETAEATKDSGEATHKDAGSEFMAWLVNGITNYQLDINTAQARVHVVDEGLLLISPAIFKDFDAVLWGNTQKRFLKLKKHRKNGDMNIWQYSIQGGRKPLSGLLIPDYEQLGIPAIPANKKLSLKTKDATS